MSCGLRVAMALREPPGATADAMSERSDTTSAGSTTPSEAAARVADARARETRAWRCRAARDKLRIVDRAVEEYYNHLAELDAYERDVAEYRRRHAEIEAMEAPRRAARETRIAARRAVADADDDDVVSSVTSEDEPDPFRALGPAPTPPTPRDPMNDPIVAPDGAEGPPLFLLACAAMEGAGDDAVSLAKQLMSIGADPNSRGNRPQHGKNLPTLCLLIGALEAFSDPPDEKAAMMESTAASVSDDDQASPRSVVGGPAPSERSEGEEVAPSEIAPSEVAPSEGSSAAAYPALRAGTSPEARAETLKNFATAIMAAEGADVSLVGVLGPYRDARSAALTETYRGVVPYLGATRTRGAPLFLAVVAATSATTPEIAELCLDLAARLLVAGADPNARGDTPGRGRRCGRQLTPLALALAALEETAADEDRGGRPVPPRLAATILAADGVDASLASEFTHAPTAEEYKSRRVAPGECGANASRAPFTASGPPLWQAACAAAEGAGAPAVAIFRAILRRAVTRRASDRDRDTAAPGRRCWRCASARSRVDPRARETRVGGRAGPPSRDRASRPCYPRRATRKRRTRRRASAPSATGRDAAPSAPVAPADPHPPTSRPHLAVLRPPLVGWKGRCSRRWTRRTSSPRRIATRASPRR